MKSSRLHKVIAPALVALMLGACSGDGNDEGGGSSSSVEPTADDESGPSVRRGAFCSDIETDVVAEALGVDEVRVISEVEPGETYEASPGGGQIESHQWSCTIGEDEGEALTATWHISGGDAKINDLSTTLKTQRGLLGDAECKVMEDESLGEGSRGLDCRSNGKGRTGPAAVPFAALTRLAVVDDALLECFLASGKPGDLATFREAAASVCGLLVDVVVAE